MKKLLLVLFLGMFLISFVKADTLGLTIRYIVPSDEVTFDNCRNFIKYTNNVFSESITASSDYEIEAYWLNDTSYFNVNNTGVIVNVTLLDSAMKHSLNLSANNSIGKSASCSFYVDVREASELIGVLCRYKKFGYYNTKLSWFKEDNCI